MLTILERVELRQSDVDQKNNMEPLSVTKVSELARKIYMIGFEVSRVVTEVMFWVVLRTILEFIAEPITES